MSKTFDKYELLRELGRGGQALVYEARDTTLDRTVALKILLPGMRTEEGIERFQREARIAARLDHDNVVSVYEVGEWRGRHYIAMELVKGDPLDKLISGRGLPVTEAISIAKQVADGIQAAHDTGIVHRDIKPANIMIDEGGRPKLTDFGLAIDETAQARVTRSGMVVGTVSYLSPEQAKGTSKTADARSDVYSLGAVLYEMLTGRPPFKALTSLALLEKIVNEHPRPPSELRKLVTWEAQTICLKCLEKSPDLRYQSARGLAEDCGRLLAGEPISARPASALSIAKRQVVRYRAPLLAGAALIVIALLGAWVVHLRSGGDGAPAPPAAGGPAEKLAEIRSRIESGADDYAGLRTALEAFPSFFPDATGEVAEAKRLLARIDEEYASRAEAALAEAQRQAEELAAAGKVDDARSKLRAVRDTYRRGPWLARRGEGLIAAAIEKIDRPAFPDASVVAAGPRAPDAAPRGEVPAPDHAETRVVAEAPAPRDEVVRAPTHTERTRPAGQRAPPRSGPAPAAGAAPAGADAQSVDKALDRFDDLIEEGDYAGARKAAEGAAAAYAGAQGADSLRAAARVAAALETRPASARRALEARVGGQVELVAKVGTIRGALAEVTDDGIVLRTEYVINRETREKLVTVKWQSLSPAQVDELAREGGWETEGADAAAARAYLALGRKDEPELKEALDAAGAHPLAWRLRRRIWASNLLAIEAAARAEWSRIEELPIVTAVLQQDAAPSAFGAKGWIPLEGNASRLYAVAFSPDGRHLAGGGYTSTVGGRTTSGMSLWEASTGKKVEDFAGLGNYVRAVAFSPDGKKLAGGDSSGSLAVWDVSAPRTPRRLPGHGYGVKAVAFSPDGRYLASASSDGTMFLWDIQTGAKLISDTGLSVYGNSVAFSPDGRVLAVGGYRGTTLWSLPTCTKGRVITGHTAYVMALAFSPNSRFLVTGGYDKTVILWNVSTGSRVRTLEGFFGRITAVAFLDNGRLLATGTTDGTIDFWDYVTNRKTKTIQLRKDAADADGVSSDAPIVFSADGRYVAIAGYGQQAQIWLLEDKPAFARADIRAVLARLVAFEKSYGATEFGKSVADKIANLRAAASGLRKE